MYSYIVKGKIDWQRVNEPASLGRNFAISAIANQFQGKTHNFEIIAEEDYSITFLVEYETIQKADELLSDLEKLKTFMGGMYYGIEVFVVTNRLSL